MGPKTKASFKKVYHGDDLDGLVTGMSSLNDHARQILTSADDDFLQRQGLGLLNSIAKNENLVSALDQCREESYGDGDQSKVAGAQSQILRLRWASGGDYDPLGNERFSQWLRDCYNGNLAAIKAHLENDPKLIDFRESVLRLPGIFHVINGAKTVMPAKKIEKQYKAKVTKATDFIGALKHLLANGASVHSRDIAGNTPLHAAAGSFASTLTFEMAEILIRHGADVNAVNRMGCSPIFEPIMSGRLDCVDFLLENGAEVEMFDNDGCSITSLGKGNPVMGSRFSKALARKSAKMKYDAGYGLCYVCKESSSCSRCSACFLIWYCGPECQKMDWKRHKPECKKTRESYKTFDLVDLPGINIHYSNLKPKRFPDGDGAKKPKSKHMIVKIQIPLKIVDERMADPSFGAFLDQLKGLAKVPKSRNSEHDDLLIYNQDKSLFSHISSGSEHYEELVQTILDKGIAGKSKGYFCAIYDEKDGFKINCKDIQIPQDW